MLQKYIDENKRVSEDQRMLTSDRNDREKILFFFLSPLPAIKIKSFLRYTIYESPLYLETADIN